MSERYTYGWADWRMSDAERARRAEFASWWGPAKRRSERALAFWRAAAAVAPVLPLIIAIILVIGR
jgi:hypothetical protein